MPAHIKIFHAHEFIQATPEGKLDFERTRKLLLEIAAASDEAPLDKYEIILDIRKAKSEMSIGDLWQLAVELCKSRKAFSQKTAVLCPVEQFNLADFFALCAQNNGFRVNAFTSFGDAMEWLIEA